jgi:hypothetical protein
MQYGAVTKAPLCKFLLSFAGNVFGWQALRAALWRHEQVGAAAL